ncbi:thioesterase family protein [Nocardia sp. CA-128927]|uniref:thioesterase family protein n=1 Tax=Nocardia sp. CA-128927 TaxID=3239975 RepID=UPI003D95F6D9
MNTFSAVTAVTRKSQSHFTAEVSSRWTVGHVPNGGYLLAIVARAAAGASAHPDVLAASAQYLRPPDIGTVEIEVEVVRVGTGASQLRARLVQHGIICVDALLIMGTLKADTQEFWRRAPEPTKAILADCTRIPSTMPNGMPAAIMAEIDARLDPDSMRFVTQGPTGRGELRGWLTLPDNERFDPFSLLFAVDSFPPATLDIADGGWVPTLQLSAYVRALPAPGPVRILQKAHLIEGRRVDESCYVWDSTGRLVAQATQLASIGLG